MMRPQMEGLKPDGMWYSVGMSWLNWCQSESFGGIPRFIDEIKVDESRILKITTLKEFDAFEKEFGCPDSIAVRAAEILKEQQERGISDDYTNMIVKSLARQNRNPIGEGSGNPYTRSIDWLRVKTQYGGIEIAPYQWKRRLSSFWYYGWDCASGAIWDRDVLISRQRLYEFNAYKKKYTYKKATSKVAVI